MRKAQIGWAAIAACLLSIAVSGVLIPHNARAVESLAPISQSLTYTEDKQGIQLTYTASAGAPSVTADMAGELLTQALGEFVRQFPQYSGDLAFTITALQNHQTAFVVRPWEMIGAAARGLAGSGATAMGAGEPPEMPGPPPAYPGTPNDVSDVAYRRYANGYQRDTQYHRCLTCGPNGGPGPWQVLSDHVDYIGGGAGGGGGGGHGGGGSGPIGGGKPVTPIVIVYPPE